MGREKAYRHVDAVSPEVEAFFQGWVDELDRLIGNPATDRNELCREVLAELHFGRPFKEVETAFGAPRGLPGARRATALSLDPRNVTLESEYYRDVDPERFYPRKPLMWLWIMYDRSPAGHNDALGILFRRMLAKHCFKR